MQVLHHHRGVSGACAGVCHRVLMPVGSWVMLGHHLIPVVVVVIMLPIELVPLGRWCLLLHCSLLALTIVVGAGLFLVDVGGYPLSWLGMGYGAIIVFMT